MIILTFKLKPDYTLLTTSFCLYAIFVKHTHLHKFNQLKESCCAWIYLRKMVAKLLYFYINSFSVNQQKQPLKVPYKKGVLRNFVKFTRKHLCQRRFFNKVEGVKLSVKKDALAQVFSCEFCEISKNNFSTEHVQTNISLLTLILRYFLLFNFTLILHYVSNIPKF